MRRVGTTTIHLAEFSNFHDKQLRTRAAIRDIFQANSNNPIIGFTIIARLQIDIAWVCLGGPRPGSGLTTTNHQPPPPFYLLSPPLRNRLQTHFQMSSRSKCDTNSSLSDGNGQLQGFSGEQGGEVPSIRWEDGSGGHWSPEMEGGITKK